MQGNDERKVEVWFVMSSLAQEAVVRVLGSSDYGLFMIQVIVIKQMHLFVGHGREWPGN
jgi:hypothetical protein